MLLSEAIKDPGKHCYHSRATRRTLLHVMLQLCAGVTRPCRVPADLDGLREDLRQLVREDGLEISDYDQELGYDYWPADHVLRVGWPLHNSFSVSLAGASRGLLRQCLIAHMHTAAAGAATQQRLPGGSCHCLV